MKKSYIALFYFLFSLGLISSGYSKNVRSNHSYRNLGFTQLPTVSIGGSIDVSGASPTQKTEYSKEVLNNVSTYDPITGNMILKDNIKSRATDDINFSGEASLLFKINGLNDYGFKYGAVMELNAGSTQNSWNNDFNATKSYIYGESLIGKVEFGNELGVSQKMKIDAGTFARGAGGINGKYLNFINLPSIMRNSTPAETPLFILIPEHPTAHGGFGVGYNNLIYLCDYNGDGSISNDDELKCYSDNSNQNYRLGLEEMQNATKISYYTPDVYGFQAGVSYTPDTGNKGASGRLSSKLDTGDIDEVIEYGATFNQTIYGLGIAVSFTGQLGKSESKKLKNNEYVTFREDLNSYQYGANLTFFGLTIGGSIGNWHNSLYNITEDKDKGEGEYTTLGIAYEFEGFNASFGYFGSKFQDNEYEAYSISIDYKVAQGFLPYVEYTHFNFKPNDENFIGNRGDVVLVGFTLNF